MIAALSTVYESAGFDRTATSLGAAWVRLPDATWTYAMEGRHLSVRNWRTLLNDPHMQSIGFCALNNVIGDGLWYRSTWGAGKPYSDEIQGIRNRINQAVLSGSMDTRMDAGNMLPRIDQDGQTLLAGLFGGNGWSIRAFKPDRPGSGGHGTCWRNVDSDRIETPPDKYSDKSVINGLRYADGMATSVFVRRFDPGAVGSFAAAPEQYDEVPFFDPEGFRRVVHFAPFRWRADGDLGVPALASGLLLAHQLRKLFAAHVSGKRIQASHPVIVECLNPEAAAAAYQKRVDDGDVEDEASILFVAKGSNATHLNTQYNGGDLEAVVNVYLRALCASVGWPWQYVLCQLTDSNMAAAQAALDQAERTTGNYQRQWLDQVGHHKDKSLIREAWGRGDLGDIPLNDELFACTWQRPRRSDANRLRSRQAAVLGMQLGMSPATLHDELGTDFDDEQRRLAENREVSLRHNNPFPPDNLPAAINQVQMSVAAAGAEEEQQQEKKKPKPTDKATP